MSTYVVAYDLYKEGQNYSCLAKKIEAYGTYWHAQGSVWIICTSQDAAEIRDNLKSCLDNNDRLIVAKLTGDGAWKGYPQNISNWLKENH